MLRSLRNRAKPLPMPPREMRELVGQPEAEGFDPPSDRPVVSTITDPRLYESVLDFGCGCGRIARQLGIARDPLPARYVGLDLHRGMIDWCNVNLAPVLPGFSFVHHDVFNPGLNPDPSLPRFARLPVEDRSVSLMIAISVFTHLTQDQAEPYLDEVARVLRDDGVLVASFFLFEKRYFPMMQDFQNALYINTGDPTNAVIFDRDWLLTQLARRGLAVTRVTPPDIRGFHWSLEISRGEQSLELPPDTGRFGHRPPPVPDAPAHTIT
jgi:SAM-dependent methyltransferase